MRRPPLPLASILLLAACNSVPPPTTAKHEELEIGAAHATPDEAATAAQLQRLTLRYNVEPWLFTHHIVIDEIAVPHSHPTLTLNARHLSEQELLLSAFLNGEMHWFLRAHPAELANVTSAFQQLFPDVPAVSGDKENKQASYEFLAAIELEHQVLTQLLGPARTETTMRALEADEYGLLYKIARENRDVITAILAKNHLNLP